ncbi:MAG: glutamyl-tRNA reductase [Deltaproteobacteria bacterium]|nr:glutamyl-tRNA reductase [Deltaproteobacteria bacterium]
MDIIVIGLNHKTAPVEIRERVSFPEKRLEESLKRILSLSSIKEDMILSTCNRVELYANAHNADEAVHELKLFLSEFHGVPAEDLERSLYIHHGEEAVRHLFRVASSLDSMVVGEPQILGQVKGAFGTACRHRTAGTILNRLLHRAFAVAKRVRTETKIGNRAVSVSFVAVQLAQKIFGNLQDKAVLLVGAGEMCELAARHLVTRGASRVTVTNRTAERAHQLARMFGGDVLPFDRLTDALRAADIIITSTASPGYLIRYDDMAGIIKARRNRSMFFIDIAVPRDVDPRVNSIENVYLYDIDDLQGVADANMRDRRKEAEKAEEIVEREVARFCQWYRSLETVPTVRLLRDKFESIRQGELKKAYSALPGASEKERKVLDALTSAIVNKILHDPITMLKRADQNSSGEELVDAARRLFHLEKAEGIGRSENQTPQDRHPGK